VTVPTPEKTRHKKISTPYLSMKLSEAKISLCEEKPD